MSEKNHSKFPVSKPRVRYLRIGHGAFLLPVLVALFLGHVCLESSESSFSASAPGLDCSVVWMTSGGMRSFSWFRACVFTYKLHEAAGMGRTRRPRRQEAAGGLTEAGWESAADSHVIQACAREEMQCAACFPCIPVCLCVRLQRQRGWPGVVSARSRGPSAFFMASIHCTGLVLAEYLLLQLWASQGWLFLFSVCCGGRCFCKIQ